MTTEDRRKFPRIESINLAYLYMDERNHITNHGKGKTINVSEEGLLIETDIEINPGHNIIALIEIPGNSVELKGKIIYCTPNGDKKFTAGIKLTETSEDGKSIWKKFVDRLLITN
jgi:Tfp pilus assembly protein PilZ